MAIHLRPNAPPSPATDDIWIMPDGTRQRWDGAAWQPVEQDAAHPDPGVVAGGGTLSQKLSKTGAQYGQTGWVSSADGLVFQHTQTNADVLWTVTHGLISRWVDVTCIDTSRGNVTMIPDITYATVNVCQLRFAEPVSGIALVRR